MTKEEWLKSLECYADPYRKYFCDFRFVLSTGGTKYIFDTNAIHSLVAYETFFKSNCYPTNWHWLTTNGEIK